MHTASADRAAAHRMDHRRSVTLRETRTLDATRASTRRSIAALEAVLVARTADRDALAVSLFSAKGQLTEAQATLSREASGLEALDTRVGALRSCLLGVSGALNALSVGDAGTAITRLRAVGADCDDAS